MRKKVGKSGVKVGKTKLQFGNVIMKFLALFYYCV